jgi:hypothetical protein
MKLGKSWMVVVMIFALLQLSACTQKPNTAAKVSPVSVAPVPGTDFTELMLIEEAATRLGIQTDSLREEQVVRKRIFTGEVVRLPATSNSNDSSSGRSQNNNLLVRVLLSPSDVEQVDSSQPALILPLTQNEGASGIQANMVKTPDTEDDSSNAPALYYALDGTAHDLVEGQRVRVELMGSSETPRKIIPYASVVYDPSGATWIYTSPKPLTFIRQPIVVDYIEADLAILVEGPSAGTIVVTAGSAELYGEEYGIGH